MSEQLPPPIGAPVEAATPTSETPKVIVWAFILSLAGFLILTALAAVAMVLTNWSKVNAVGKGKGLAIAALVISGFWLLIMVVALSTSSDDAAESVGTEVVEVFEAAPESEPAVKEPTVEVAPQPFNECIRTPYQTEYLAQASALSGETANILKSAGDAESLGDILLVIDRTQKKGTEWDAVGRLFKFADDCGDRKFGDLNAELGDLLIVLGGQMSSLDGEEMVLTGDISPLETVNDSIKRATNQLGVITDYLSSK